MQKCFVIWFALFVTMLWLPQSYALVINYDANRDPALRECDELRYANDSGDEECYSALLSSDSALLRADAASELGDVRAANKNYREAASNSDDPIIKTHWGYLYLATHQVSDATALFREAMLYDSEYLPAQIGLARALGEGYEGKSREALQEITVEHPDNIQALILLAKIELELQNLQVARGLLNRANLLATEHSLPQREIYALLGAADLLDRKPITPMVNKALAESDSYGDAYAIIAHYYIITYRYREAVELYQQAVDTTPELASAHRDLGINFLRINNIFGARYHIKKSFELDPYDAKTVNTLRLLDKFDDMRVSSVAVSNPKNLDETLGQFIVRLDREDADALEPYVIDLATRAMQHFTNRYEFRLKQPMIVELFHDHDDFGVRTVSTPGIGLLGVTFGYLTAMDSPKARAAGEFHWGSTLWHEIAHVYTLEASNHQLPRWFSEGLSVYEEWNTGPLVSRELPMPTLTAIRDNQFLPIAELDWGFVRPSYQGQVTVSYNQAGLICDFISNRWGHQALVTMLKAFAEGDDTERAIEKAIDMSATQFDVEFAAFIDARWGVLASSLSDYQIAERQMMRSVVAEDWESVETLARSLIRQYPERVGEGNPYEFLAKAHEELFEPEAAAGVLEQWYQAGGHAPENLLKLSEALRSKDQNKLAATVIEQLNWVTPYYTQTHEWLGNYYLDHQQPAIASREFDALLGLQEQNPAVAYLGRARAAKDLGQSDDAKQQVLYALEHAPFYRPAQQLLLELNNGASVD
ncbi:MAG: hypothetical protein V3U65_05180 [Granulosicoccaceae bacterium]